MIGQFNMGNIRLLQEMGYEAHVACNFKEGNTCDESSIRELRKNLKGMQVSCFHVDFSRNIKDVRKHLKAYRQVVYLLRKNGYQFIHCHSPIGGVIGRLAAHKAHTKVIYTAHGFHFYKGAPVKNWIMYFPIEWMCSFWTDLLITINKEDYAFAQKHLHSKKTEYVPGVGIDLERFSVSHIDKQQYYIKREELGIPCDSKIILSVGELNKNKNHEIVIRALAKLKDKNIHYVIAGTGELKNYLHEIAEQLTVCDRVHLVGFRNDIDILYKLADLYVHPSLREGLSVALMEAIASKKPVICSGIRGNMDLIEPCGQFAPKRIFEIADKIEEYLGGDKRKEIESNYENLRKFDIEKVMIKMQDMYIGLENIRENY